jgi:hypothetical protein
VTLQFSLQVTSSNIEFRVSSNGMTNLYVDTVTVSPDLYESFSVRRGLRVYSGQITNDTSSQSGEVALSRKGLNEGILTYGPYIALQNGIYTAVFRIKTNATEQNATITFDVTSQMGTNILSGPNILSNRTLRASEIHDGSWFDVTLQFSLKVLTTNIEFRVTSNGMTTLYVDTVTVMFL